MRKEEKGRRSERKGGEDRVKERTTEKKGKSQRERKESKEIAKERK